MARSLRLACLLVALVSAPCSADPLNPLDYPSLGNLSLGGGSLFINTNNLTITGSAGFLGISRPQENGDSQIAIFNFDSINLGPGVSVSITGDRPLALLSRGSASILPSLFMNATVPFSSETRPGPGGYFGGHVFGASPGHAAPGSGPGGGISYGSLSIGGSFGGMSGTMTGFSPIIPGTAPYGDLLSKLEGGSGGGVYNTAGGGASSGGSGGGAIEIGAVGPLTLGFIQANGSGATSSVGGFSAGGGAGGGILVHSDTGSVTLTNQLQARGGGAASTFSGNYATGGGGGRIALLGLSTQTLGTTPGPGGIFDLTGGSSVSGPAGFAGVVTVGAIQTIVPNGRSVVLDGDPVISIAGGANQTQPTYEAIIDRDVTINVGGSVTLGKSEPLRSDSDLTVNGQFNTDAYTQTVARLTGSGVANIGLNGKLIVGFGNFSDVFTGAVSGSGQLVKIGAGTLTLSGTVSGTRVIDVQGGDVLMSGLYTGSDVFTKTGLGELVVTGTWLPDGRTQIEQGVMKFINAAVVGGQPWAIHGGGGLEVHGGTLSVAIDGTSAASEITTTGTTALGLANNFTGFRHAGHLAVQDDLTINSRGMAQLGVLTELIGGATISAPNGLSLGVGANVYGVGAVNAKIAAGFGSVIEADGGDLELGDAASTVGFASDGELRTGVNDVTINDANEAVLGTLTTLGDGVNEGSLIAGDATIGDTHVHLLLSEGKNMVGRGNVVGNFKNNGHVEGDGTGAGQRIVFDNPWIVSGIGSFTNTMVNGTFAPGLSPGVVQTSNLGLGGVLEIELGGAAPGIGAGHHDQVNDDATLELIDSPTLAIKAYGGFLPTLGQEFDIINAAGGINGGFGAVTIDPWLLAQGIGFELLEDSEGLSLRAVAAAGDFTADGLVDGSDFLAWQRGFGTLDSSDLADWNARFGTDPDNAATIPEPASLVLAVVAALACGRRRTVGNAL